MGFEPMMRVLQTLALPLGDVAAWRVKYSSGRNHTRITSICQFKNARRGLRDCFDSLCPAPNENAQSARKAPCFPVDFASSPFTIDSQQVSVLASRLLATQFQTV
jgi:hypothetical protein